MPKKQLEGLGLHSKTTPILPITHDDILGSGGPQQDDLVSVANSLQSSSTTLSSFAKRQQHKLKIKNLKKNMDTSFTVPRYFKRILNVRSLDFETALWEMLNLIVQPKRVYKSLYYQKQTKNKWSRDDPSFVLILSFFLTISAIFWGMVYSTSVITIFKLILYMVIVDFVLVGIVVATAGWVIANNYFLQDTSMSSQNSNRLLKFFLPTDSTLEWAYCFDIHCNAYLIIWVCLYFIQFFLLPLLRLNNWISTVLGNTLYLASATYYCIITFYGYNALPFLQKTEYLLAPIPVFVLVWIVLTLAGFNIANFMSNAYFN
ncbi:hypothetical protein OGAPHI_004164 [Ogataea philodendri]|uniref:Protein GMH1 n=1 Tax=Ogataea philodendri TaxID=1378263 RepID=A0A9P8T5D1_9ASCO|nr:uncharacterized protein OGAPHI_004164 [Ogataea philodendri]KAH3665975.1 hypothetical protein OGAPHI_004164 [Ogataea philodendri]